MIDQDGYRANIAIVIANAAGQTMWFKRCGQSAWQFPQGGLRQGESLQGGMYRELAEETGVLPEHVSILGQTKDWFYYNLPEQLVKKGSHCIGQKQIWFLLRLHADTSVINLNITNEPEFESWNWIDADQAVDGIIYFKRDVYRKALNELKPFWPTTQ